MDKIFEALKRSLGIDFKQFWNDINFKDGFHFNRNPASKLMLEGEQLSDWAAGKLTTAAAAITLPTLSVGMMPLLGLTGAGYYLTKKAYLDRKLGQGDHQRLEHTAIKAAALYTGYRALQNPQGFLTGLGRTIGSLTSNVKELGSNLEKSARFLLTSNSAEWKTKRWMNPDRVSAWFPHAKTLPFTDFRKYALNPSIIKRGVGVLAAAGLVRGFTDAVLPKIPEATVFFDGQYIRGRNDLGAHAGYAQSVLGANSAFAANNINAGEVGAALLRFL